MEYFETCSIGEASIVQVFDHLFNSLLALVPNPPDPAQLMGKNVVLGQRVLNDIKFKLFATFASDTAWGYEDQSRTLQMISTNIPQKVPQRSQGALRSAPGESQEPPKTNLERS